ncbi:Asp/Glu/hydantoin racemase [Dillenia turbinata]|uniref:Asp/Glu/hydantoin racemase n=1 Tax=Dillenia turbinata TaxID=194707 RepID=A0AAN8ZP92_9MAGN
MSCHGLNINCSQVVPLGNLNMKRTMYRARINPSQAAQQSSVPIQMDDNNSGSCVAVTSSHSTNPLLSQANTVGVIGGVSVFSTLIFLEKLVWWSSRYGKDFIPFIVCSDPVLSRELSLHKRGKKGLTQMRKIPIVENLKHKRTILEQSGARCIVMPCHLSHEWYSEIFEGCSAASLHVGECVARELKEAKLKPIQAGCDVRIGVLTTDATMMAGFYQEKLQNQGFEVVLPDKATMEHIVGPAMEAWRRKDMEGARNLLRIAIHLLLTRAVNTVILASDEMQGLLPLHDPLLKKCVDPMDALARSTITWAEGQHDPTL